MTGKPINSEQLRVVMRTRFVSELHQNESRRSSLPRKHEPCHPKGRGIAGVLGALGYPIPVPYQVRDDVLCTG